MAFVFLEIICRLKKRGRFNENRDFVRKEGKKEELRALGRKLIVFVVI